jgi:hypothetical protein
MMKTGEKQEEPLTSNLQPPQTQGALSAAKWLRGKFSSRPFRRIDGCIQLLNYYIRCADEPFALFHTGLRRRRDPRGRLVLLTR